MRLTPKPALLRATTLWSKNQRGPSWEKIRYTAHCEHCLCLSAVWPAHALGVLAGLCLPSTAKAAARKSPDRLSGRQVVVITNQV